MKNFLVPRSLVPAQRKKQIQKFRAASKAKETKRALKKNWEAFENWCLSEVVSSFPCSADVLEAYLVHLAERGLKTATIDQAKWAVDVRHKLSAKNAPGDTEQIRVVMAGIKRTLGSRQSRKAALTIDHIRQIPFGDDLIAKRDKALLLTGFAGGLRRSEIAALKVEDIEQTPAGLRLFLSRSKTDQEGKGEWVEIVRAADLECCPVESLRSWVSASNISKGFLFRSINRWGALGSHISTVTIGKIVKNAAASCGLDPAEFGGHSLRAGCATYLLDKGIPLNVVAKQGRWKKADTVLRYDRNVTVNALKGIY